MPWVRVTDQDAGGQLTWVNLDRCREVYDHYGLNTGAVLVFDTPSQAGAVMNIAESAEVVLAQKTLCASCLGLRELAGPLPPTPSIIQASSFDIYLAGPMTGLPDFNRPAFASAAKHLRGLGKTVFSPHEVAPPGEDVDPAQHRSYYMRVALAKLAQARTVWVLPGWEASRGAKLEVATAQQTGKPVFCYPDGQEMYQTVTGS